VNYFNWNYGVLTRKFDPSQGLDAWGRQLNVGLHYPRLLFLLPAEVGTRIDGLHERVKRPSYDFQRSAGIFGIDAVIDEDVSATVQYEIETDKISRTQHPGIDGRDSEGMQDKERLRYEEGRIDLHSVRSSANLDWRDDPANPRRGVFLSVGAEIVQSLGGEVTLPDGQREEPFSKFVKASGQASFYLPLARSVLAVSLKGGKVFPLDDRSRTIAPRRFFLGGASSMRGFLDETLIPEDRRQALREQVRQCESALNKTGCSEAAQRARSGEPLASEGGELFTLARAELRVPIAGELEGALFVDAGNLWLDQSQYDPLRLRYAAGAGIRIVTPIGPAAVDLGINLTPDLLLNESQFVPHLSIGLF